MKHIISIALLCFATSAPTWASPVQFNYKNIEGQIEVGSGNLERPEKSNGKAVVILHNNGGYQEGTTKQYASMLISKGFTTLEVETFPNPKQRKSSVVMLQQAYGALSYLAGQPGIQRDQISLMGISIGGMVTVYARTKWAFEKFSIDNNNFAKAIGLQVSCWEMENILNKDTSKKLMMPVPHEAFSTWTGKSLTLHVGSNDDYDGRDPNTCKRFLSLIPEDSQKSMSRVVIHDGATHGWDQAKGWSNFLPFACKGNGCKSEHTPNPGVTKTVMDEIEKELQE